MAFMYATEDGCYVKSRGDVAPLFVILRNTAHGLICLKATSRSNLESSYRFRSLHSPSHVLSLRHRSATLPSPFHFPSVTVPDLRG